MSSLGMQMRRLGRHSAVYGLGGIVSRVLAVFLLPLYTRYLTPADLGAVGLVVALSAVVVTILRAGISSAFFRFYFDSTEPGAASARRPHLVLVHDGERDRSASSPASSSPSRSPTCSASTTRTSSAPVSSAIWAQMNYEQLTSLFRAEERSTAFVLASLANIAVTIGATILLVVVWEQGALGVIVGNFTGTLVVYLALLAVHREQLGLQFSRPLLREMNRFGVPLVPAALALIVVNFSDRFFLVHLASLSRRRAVRDRRPDRLGDGAAADRVPDGLARVRLLDRRTTARPSARTRSCSRTSSSSPPGSRSAWGCSPRGSCGC